MTECVDEVLAERTLLTFRGKGTNLGADWSVRLQRPNWPLRFRPTDHKRPRISIMSIWFFEIATSEIAHPTLMDVESRVVAWSFPIVVLRRVRFEKKLVISSSLSYKWFIYREQIFAERYCRLHFAVQSVSNLTITKINDDEIKPENTKRSPDFSSNADKCFPLKSL